MRYEPTPTILFHSQSMPTFYSYSNFIFCSVFTFNFSYGLGRSSRFLKRNLAQVIRLAAELCYAHNCNERYSDLKKNSLYEKVYRLLLLLYYRLYRLYKLLLILKKIKQNLKGLKWWTLNNYWKLLYTGSMIT